MMAKKKPVKPKVTARPKTTSSLVALKEQKGVDKKKNKNKG